MASQIKKFEKVIWSIRHHGECMPGEEEEELVMMDAKISLKCPVSGMLLEDPVKNTLCGHIYSRQAILGLIGSKRTIPCPFAGCSKMVSKRTLVNDLQTQRELKKHVRELEMKKKRGQDTKYDFTQDID